MSYHNPDTDTTNTNYHHHDGSSGEQSTELGEFVLSPGLSPHTPSPGGQSGQISWTMQLQDYEMTDHDPDAPNASTVSFPVSYLGYSNVMAPNGFEQPDHVHGDSESVLF